VANNVSNTVSVILNSTTFSIGNGLAGSQFPSSQYIDVGLKLKATPRIHLNHEVTLQLEFEISSLAGSSYNNIPVISSQTLHQTVRVKEDETAAIGAFREPQYTRSLNGVPALGGVPGAGLLGADVNTSKEDTELVILVTPHIVAREARKDHTVYAGRGAPEGPGALGPTRDERQAPLRQPRAQPQPPPAGQGEPPAQPEPGQQPEPQPEPGAQPEPQTEPPPPQQ
jgi:type II secretory pathway component GspD/PulD (secretin)